MNEINLEYRAQELLRHNEYSEALILYNQLLSLSNSNLVSKERIINFLLARSECCLVLGKHEDVVFDCRKIIKLVTGIENEAGLSSKARRRLVHALFTLNRFSEAEQAATEWIASSPNQGGGVNGEALKMLERVQMLRMVNGNGNGGGGGGMVPPHLVQKAPMMKNSNSSSYLDALDSAWSHDLTNSHLSSSKQLENLLDMNSGVAGGGNYQQNSALTNGLAAFHNGYPMSNDPGVNPLTLTSTPSSSSVSTSLSSSDDVTSSSLSRKSSMNNGNTSNSISIDTLSSTASSDKSSTSIGGNNSISNSNQNQNQNNSSGGSTSYNCVYCSLSFSDKMALRSHCGSESHQMVIMSDEGRDWKWRPPPRGFTADNYSLCEWFEEGGESACRYGAQCVEAHGAEELQEWRMRFEYRRMKLQRASEKELYGKSYTEQLLDRWVQSSCPDKVLKEEVEDVEVSCDQPLVTSVSSKVSDKQWTFTLRTNRTLKAVALLQDAHRNHFKFEALSTQDLTHGATLSHELGDNDQEWLSPLPPPPRDSDTLFEHRIRISFVTEIYGTFRQSLVVDFGHDPVLVKHLCVDVIPVHSVEKIKEIKKELVLSNAERWEPDSVSIVRFVSTAVNVDSEQGSKICAMYPAPRAHTFSLTQSTIEERRLTRYNYKPRMHELLYVEEMARYEQVARYNLRAKLKLVDCYLLSPSGVAGSTAKYAQSGELFAVMNLGKDISEDTSAGRLILNNCAYVFFSDVDESIHLDSEGKRIVHEIYIEDKGKNVIYLRVSANTVSNLKLKKNTDVNMDVQFQLNRVPYCEWHQAIDSVADFRIIFPDTYVEPHIPPVTTSLCSALASKLNSKQKEAVAAITAPTDTPLPPVLIIGPFGTGKTYTLANAIKEVLKQPDTRILVCTHSNSAADLYIKDYLHPYVQEGHDEAKPLRIYYHKRWVATVNSIVQQYCVIQMNNGIREFKMPSLEEIEAHRVVVVTLSISLHLATVGLKKGHFTHILLDEAAQAMECEAIMPLALANDNTRIVLAGDHMQLSPEIFSQFAKERQLHISLLERLYDHYPSSYPCKILLRENYRAHEAIIEFTSELFYEQQLISSGNQPRHDKFHPLTFFTTRGEDVQDHNSTAFYNNSEVYEVVERVSELKKKWPSAWGKLDEHAIGIMTPYADQVVRIRSELRKRRMGGISVERVLNVQGKQFRAIFLSTVRTRRTCQSAGGGGGSGGSANGEDLDYGFLSNSKLLNTAITRAQSLVAVVGDPVALCSIGRCRKVWERFIEICNLNSSLFGITWKSLRAQLDGVELKKTYVLNPLAPEFVPRSFQPESYIRLQTNRYTSSASAGGGLGSTGNVFSQQHHHPSQQQQQSPNNQTNSAQQAPTSNPLAAAFPSSLHQMYYPSQQPQPTSNSAAAFQTLHMRPPPPLLNQQGWGQAALQQQQGGWGQKIKSSSSKDSSIASPLGSTDDFQRHLSVAAAAGAGPLPPSRPPPRSLSPSSIDFTNPNTFLRPPPNMLMTHLDPSLGSQARRLIPSHLDKDLQFLQNVHFPSPHSHPSPPEPSALPSLIPSLSSPVKTAGSGSAALADYQHLLPVNISLAELAQSPNKQYEWFIHLVDTAGIETANKFFEFITSSSASTTSSGLASSSSSLQQVNPAAAISPVSLLHKSYLPSQQQLLTNQQLNNLELLHKQQRLVASPQQQQQQQPNFSLFYKN
uniref:Probable helicase with zinc finger domain n=1 Tax=Cacopsylla melanoneura TaxID=428564 RepID=A0A8D8U4A8_9HEMI